MVTLSPPAGPTAPQPRRSGDGTGFRSRHVRWNIVVVGWLAAALTAVAFGQTFPAAQWLALHLFLLGAVTNSVVLWSEHFTVALLHAPHPDSRWSDARLAGLNLSVLAVIGGTWADDPALTGIGATGVAAVVVAHCVVLTRMGRDRLGGRLAPVTYYYRAATVALAAGAVLGGLLTTGWGAAQHTALLLAHIHVNLLGWVGLPVLGTLFMLWPTVLAVRMADRTVRVARRSLWLLLSGLTLNVAGLLAGLRYAAAAGLALYAAGVVLAVVLFAGTARRRAPHSPAAWMLAAATGWFVVALLMDLVLMLSRSADSLRGDLQPVIQVLLVGFVGQVLLGALTYLLPVVLGRGRGRRVAVTTTLERAWRPRMAALNLAVPLLLLPLPGPAGAAGWLLAVAAVAAFVLLCAVVLVRQVRTGGEAEDRAAGRTERKEAGKGRGPSGRAPLLGTAAGILLTVAAVVLATTSGGSPSGTGGQTGPAAAGTRTVQVVLADMRISPASLHVTAGTRLVLEVTNRDSMRHDLRVEDGPGTPLLAKGGSARLDLGTVTDDRAAWCTVPGHRAAGMSMRIIVDAAGTGTAEEPGADTAAPGHDGHDTSGTDAAAGFSAGWKPRSAVLPPAGSGRLHKVRLNAVDKVVEVAPGVRQRMWTFGGTAPGPVLRGKVGDTFEITLTNDSDMGHGIDFHPGSLAPDRAMRTIQPGEELVYRFRAEHAGAWLYHCSTAPMLQHMGNGMYGAVVIDPPDLPDVDREYLLVGSQLYLGTPGSDAQVAKMRNGTPDAWVFNGVARQYAEAPLTARPGERVRFWVVAAGPSDGIAFHVVGTVFDTVYKEGAYALRPSDGGRGGSQVLDLGPAQGGFVETRFPAAGHYSFVDHDMRHAEAGAHGTVRVER